MAVVTLKLKNGDELIGDVYEESAQWITLRKARLLLLVTGGAEGSLQLRLMPWMYGVSQDGLFPPLDKSHVMIYNSKVPAELTQRYMAETSPIQLVT
jgi:hypothetical protein